MDNEEPSINKSSGNFASGNSNSNNSERDRHGTDGDDYLNPEGRGDIYTGRGQDVVVLSEGDFFNIEGFQDLDNPIASVKSLERANGIRSFIGREELEVKEDRLLIFIDPEKERTQQVQYFIEGGTTYVRLFDTEEQKTVAATRVTGTDFKIEVVGENGNLGVEPKLLSGKQDRTAEDIRDLITHGEVRDSGILENFASNKIQKASDRMNTVTTFIDNLIRANNR